MSYRTNTLAVVLPVFAINNKILRVKIKYYASLAGKSPSRQHENDLVRKFLRGLSPRATAVRSHARQPTRRCGRAGDRCTRGIYADR